MGPPQAAAHRGERATVAQRTVGLAEVVRCEPVDQAVRRAGVLGEVQVSAIGIDGDRLVGEAPERRQRCRADVVGRRLRIHLEDETVVTVRRRAGLRLGLLAGEPRAPRGQPTGAVAERPRQADVLVDPIQVVVEGQGGRAPLGLRIVGELGGGEGREGIARTDLVVLHQPHSPLGALERRGAVVAARCESAPRKRVTGPRHDLIREPGRQVENPRRVQHRRTDARGCRCCWTGGQQAAHVAQHDGTRAECRPGQNLSSGQIHENLLLRRRNSDVLIGRNCAEMNHERGGGEHCSLTVP